MFIVFERDTGALVYTADAEALQHLDATRYLWIEVAADWQQTSLWDPITRSLQPLPNVD